MEVSKDGIPVRQSPLEVAFSDSPEISPVEHYGEESKAKRFSLYGLGIDFSSQHESPRRRRWILIAVGVLIVIAAVVGGVVGGLLGKKGSESSIRPGPLSGTTTGSMSETSTSTRIATMSGTATATSGYSYPTAVSWGAPHLEIFVPSDKGPRSVYAKYRNEDSSDLEWNPSDTSFSQVGDQNSPEMAPVDTIATNYRFRGKLNIWYLGIDNAIYHKYHNWTPEWSIGDSNGWYSHGGSVLTAPSVVAWNSDRLDMFAIGEDSGLWHQWWGPPPANWSPWIKMGGRWTKFIPTAVSWGPNRWDVFVVDPDTNELHHTFGTDTSPVTSEAVYQFDNLGGYCTSRPIALSWTSGRIDVFVRGGDAGLWHMSYNGTWSKWNSISGTTTVQAEPEVVSWGLKRLDIFAWGIDQSLLHKSFDGDEWTPKEGFEDLGGSHSTPAKAVADDVGSLHVFTMSSDGALQLVSWNQAEGKWSPQAGNFDTLGTPG